MKYSGVYEDGWIARSSHVALAPGPAGNLVLQAEVLPHPGQRLEVVVDGKVVASETVAAGELAMQIPVPQSRTPRDVELHWAESGPLSDADPREAAALLKSLEITPPRTPSSIRLPGTLGSLGRDYSGIYRDGWVEKEAHIVLSGGSASRLVLRAHIFLQQRQHLEIVLDGERLFSEDVELGALNLRLSIPASDSNRQIDLRWGETAEVGPGDPREAAALIRFIGVAEPSAPKPQRRIPEDLDDPILEASGIYDDGWVEQSMYIVLAGGEAGVLVIRADVPAVPDQNLTVLLNGGTLSAQAVAPGPLELRLPVPATDSDRRVELLWARTVLPVGTNDAREAAALLRFVGLTTGDAPAVVQLPSALTNPDFERTGIYEDGWAQQRSTVVLAGGPAAQLTIRAHALATKVGQRLDVSVDGSVVESLTVVPGEVDVQISVPASGAPRTIELAWAATNEVSPDDPRQAAALLRMLALGTPRR